MSNIVTISAKNTVYVRVITEDRKKREKKNTSIKYKINTQEPK